MINLSPLFAIGNAGNCGVGGANTAPLSGTECYNCAKRATGMDASDDY